MATRDTDGLWRPKRREFLIQWFERHADKPGVVKDHHGWSLNGVTFGEFTFLRVAATEGELVCTRYGESACYCVRSASGRCVKYTIPDVLMERIKEETHD